MKMWHNRRRPKELRKQYAKAPGRKPGGSAGGAGGAGGGDGGGSSSSSEDEEEEEEETGTSVRKANKRKEKKGPTKSSKKAAALSAVTQVMRRVRYMGGKVVGWIGFEDTWWLVVIGGGKMFEYRCYIMEGALGAWLLVRVSFATEEPRVRVQKVVGAIMLSERSDAPRTDPTVYDPVMGYVPGKRARFAYAIHRVIVFAEKDRMPISYKNMNPGGRPLSKGDMTRQDLEKARLLVYQGSIKPGRVVFLH